LRAICLRELIAACSYALTKVIMNDTKTKLDAALLEENISKRVSNLVGYGEGIELPEIFHGCGNWYRMVAERNAELERQRQEKLTNAGKTDQELGEEIFEILKEFPCPWLLAQQRYANFWKQDLYPRKPTSMSRACPGIFLVRSISLTISLNWPPWRSLVFCPLWF
jgi:hypothetical protein